MGCTFIDIEKAFDKVWHLGLLYKLNSLKIPCYLGKWLANYLTNRTFMVRIANCLSNAQNIQTGVPQGSVLGPTLFNIYFNNIVNVLKDVDIALYADDLSFWVASTSVKYINLKLQQNLEKIYEWMCKWRLKVSYNKTVSTLFNKENRFYQEKLNLIMAKGVPLQSKTKEKKKLVESMTIDCLEIFVQKL
ncbi:unnamed protein product [Brachionus calyciflorus]|uniref:Reverse transcriptase domain-containing protein n=1 Tax=Brachionus calyciflorus TaxID=104777 RepID=A0A813M6D3_9BILA|nr:unnamed protein product [Brachionus calyciflorus]